MEYYETREERSSVKTLLEEPFSLGEYLVSSLKIGESNRMMVDNLGKNMMLDTWDGQIWYPRFYDMDTICSYNNSGEIKFDVDIEMEQGYWNTSASRLWTKVRDLLHDDLVEVYGDMRQNGMSFDSFMQCFYGDQISKIPQKYYNKDYDVKYAPYSDEYIGKAHGDGYQHLKRWLKNRLIFTDTLFDYAPSYEGDILTIRANTLEEMNLTIDTYTPVYQHVSWYNGQMDKIKVVPGQPVTFSGFAQTATDQEVLIYGGNNIKKITGISTMNPNELILGYATRLTELIATDCPLLTTINSNKANLSAHTYLNKVDLSGCSQLGGILQLHNSPLIQDINMKGTAITGLQMPTSLRNLSVLRLPNTINTLTLMDVPLLHTLEFDEGASIQSVSLSNCSSLENCINFDLTKTPTVLLDNSYNTDELYMSETTNLTLRNMSNLERVIYTPNSEYSEFDINNVIGGKNYKVTTNGCPKLKTFMTTAPHRLSYNGDDVEYKEKIINKPTIETYELNDSRWIGTIYVKNMSEGVVPISGANTRSTDYLEVVPNTECSMTTTNTDSYVGIAFFDENKNFISEGSKGTYDVSTFNCTTTSPSNAKYVVFLTTDGKGYTNTVTYYDETAETIQVKDYGEITPNTAFTANTLDLSATQFTDIKLLCTTDVYNLKVPTTMKNFYCDSAMDIDTDVIEDGSYEVIHEELIEPYTTNYEGEVLKYTDVVYDMLANWDTLPNGQSPTPSVGSTANDLIDTAVAELKTTDYIRVVPGTVATWRIEGDLSDDKFAEYDKDKKFIKSVGNANSNINGNPSGASVTLSEETHYIRLSVKKYGSYISKIELSYKEVATPNIIPSSANGSLIFNMCSNNTTQPTSTSPYMWDLTGLKLEDFYTYGMNNWVKGNSYVAQNSSEEKIYEAVEFTDNTIIAEFDLSKMDATIADFKYLLTVGIGDDITAWGGAGQKLHVSFEPNSSKIRFQAVDNNASTTYTTTYTDINIPLIIKVNKNGITYNNIDFTHNFDYDSDDYYQTMKAFKSATEITVYIGKDSSSINATYNLILNQNNIQSITMPQRMPGYSVRLVNADITPNEYPTMLYPKLIDTTLPITGKLDYTAYNGTSLAWAYAYTTGDVNISPLGSQDQGNITQDYNKLYGTDFVDIVDVWVYKDTDVSKLSTNEAITEAYIELTAENTAGDGASPRIKSVLQWYPNCDTLYFFDDGTIPTMVNLLYGTNPYREQIKKVVFMDGYFEGVTNIQGMFNDVYNLESVENLPKNATYMRNTFRNCKNITKVPEIPSNVNSLSECFYGCTSLTTTPNIPQSVTDMQGCFNGCKALTQAPTIPNGVTNMSSTFQGCTSLTTAPAIPSTVTNMSNTFYGCTSLTTAPTIPQGVTNMNSTFTSCTKLTTPPAIPQGVTDMASTFYKCTSLTQAPNIPNGVTDISMMLALCEKVTSITLPLANIQTYNGALNSTGITDITWVGERNSDFNITSLYFNGCSQQDIKELVPEHLADLTELGTTATLTLGDYASYLSPAEILFAQAKGWTIEGNYSNGGYVVVDASTALSEVNSGVTGVILELTSANYKTRIDEVLQYYPNCTDVCFIDDGSVTSLKSMLDTNNTNYKSQITNVEFVGGYFDNLTDMQNTFKGCTSLTTVSALPSSVTNMQGTFQGCTLLTTVPDIPNGVTNMYSTFLSCSSLITAPAMPNGVTEMYSTFYNCTSLTTVPNIPSSVEFMESTFQNCSKLTTVPTIPSSVTDMGYTFYGCKALTQAPKILSTSITDIKSLYSGCTNLQSCDVPIYTDACTGALYNVPSTCDITWIGERTTNLNVTGGLNHKKANATDIQELVPEHLADLTALGTTATLTLGSTYLSYLTEEEITQATNKGWTLQ